MLILGGMANVENIKHTVDSSLEFAAQGITETRQVDEKLMAYGRFLLTIRDACGKYVAELKDWEQVKNVLPIGSFDEAGSALVPLATDNPLVITAARSFDTAYQQVSIMDDKLFGDTFSHLVELLSEAQEVAEDLSEASLEGKEKLADTSSSSVIGQAQAGIESLLDYRNTL